MTRIVFVGTVKFSRHCLGAVLRRGGNVVGVFTLPEDKAGVHADYARLLDVAEPHGIEVHEVENINEPDVVLRIRRLRPDVIFVFGWSQIVSKEVLDIPPLGCIGSHPALLPRNRGRHPLVWALVEGLTESGLTFFYLDEKADSGDILWQRSFPITLEDDACSLYLKIEALASDAIHEFLPQIEGGTAPRTPQDHSQATYWRRRTEKDGEIDWAASTMTTYNLVRALTRPYVGAHTYVNGDKVKVWRARPLPAALPTEELEPGTVFARTEDGYSVRSGDGYCIIREYESANGATLEVGIRLGRTA